MDTATVSEAPAVEQPVLDAPVETSEQPDTTPAESIADHAAQFGVSPRELANTGQFADKRDDGKRKAASQRATPEDVAEINRLTRELRETEQRLADKDPDAAASPRIRTLKRQIAALKALETPAPAAKAETPAPKAEPTRTPAAPVKAETRAKPTEDEIGTKYQTYGEFVEDLADWKVEQRELAKQTEAQTREATEREQQLITTHQQRMTDFAGKTPDFHTVTASMMSQHLPGVLLAALVSDDKGPENVYYLAQHPDILDELILLTDGKDVTDASVAVVQRRVRQYAQAATTGSAAVPPKPTFNPPRPPNPVRTGPTKTADEPPGDGASIADHKRYFDPDKRR